MPDVVMPDGVRNPRPDIADMARTPVEFYRQVMRDGIMLQPEQWRQLLAYIEWVESELDAREPGWLAAWLTG